ncbi:hypothetical protein MKK55_15885 [Methylobacterium sp. J-059]|uniref:hypothetical protein n=1 Tax=Methylobacterium sp. J-059 TaxID=2836643 RepID=UPI001FBB6290|nr:hypothetical protein [Methylobacterium sp. J-059]MCJ2040412.1 hypothetical protein [Methylobacterium sp. J-059]
MFVIRDAMKPKRRNPLRNKRTLWSPARVVSVANLFKSDIEKFITGTFGGPCLTDDAVMFYEPLVRILCVRFVAMEEDGRNPRPVDSCGWAMKFMPRFALEQGRAWFEEQERVITASFGAALPALPSADELADAIGVRHQNVVDFRLRSIGATDRRAPQRAVERKAKKAVCERKRRAKAGAKAQANSKASTKPWESLGMSRSTFYRKLADGTVVEVQSPYDVAQDAPKRPNLRLVKNDSVRSKSL